MMNQKMGSQAAELTQSLPTEGGKPGLASPRGLPAADPRGQSLIGS